MHDSTYHVLSRHGDALAPEKADGKGRITSECSTEADIGKTLDNLPKDLNETYERILQKIVRKGEVIAARAERILTWLVGCMRPLRLLELEEALMIELGSVELDTSLRLIDPFPDILATCGSLVETFWDETGSQTVYLSHYTVRVGIDYLSWCNYH